MLWEQQLGLLVGLGSPCHTVMLQRPQDHRTVHAASLISLLLLM